MQHLISKHGEEDVADEEISTEDLLYRNTQGLDVGTLAARRISELNRKLFDRHHPSIQRILAQTGGNRPPTRCRSRLALSLAEREEISRGVVAGRSIRSIAAALGRAPSTVSREIRRNGGRRRYRASQADQAAWDRAQRSKTY